MFLKRIQAPNLYHNSTYASVLGLIRNKLRNFVYGPRHDDTKIFIVIVALTSAFVVDSTIIRISDLALDLLSSPWVVSLFISIAIICGIGQYLILRFVMHKSKEIMSSRKLNLSFVHKIVAAVQYFLIGIIGLAILQMVTTSHYSTDLLIIAIGASYLMAIALMSLLAYRFFSWFKLYKNAVVLLYALSSAAIGISAAVTVLFVNLILSYRPTQISSHLQVAFFFSPGSLLGSLSDAFIISSIVSFMLIWAATALLLRHYSRKIGSVRYWVILCIPLVYFLSQFLNIVVPILQLNPDFFGILFTFVFSFTKAAGGILFGVAFWLLTRNLEKGSILRNYMIISAYGLVLLFVSNQAIAVSAAFYPPFGLPSVSLIGLSSYLVLVGIYATAISMAQDSNLRKAIRAVATKESGMLESIGLAEMTKEIEKRVVKMARDSSAVMSNEIGVASVAEETEMKEYLAQVVKEISAQKDKEKSQHSD